MLVKGNDVQGHRLSEQVERKVLAHSGSLMLVEFRLPRAGLASRTVMRITSRSGISSRGRLR